MLIDIHCHLDNELLSKNIPNLIDDCKAKKMHSIINNGLNYESNVSTLKLAKTYEIIKAALGLYPIEAEKITITDFKKLRELIFKKSKDIISLGEIGLDGKYGKNIKLQEEYFQLLIEISKEINKPVIVHSRQAEAKVVEMLKLNKHEKVVMHSFTGNKKVTKEVINNNWYFSIPPAILNSKHFQFLVEIIPIDNLLTETDSPYQYTNNEFNKPYFVEYSLKMISQIKNIDFDTTSKIIFTNYKKIFQV